MYICQVEFYLDPRQGFAFKYFICNVMLINTGEERGCEAGKGGKPQNENVDEYIPPRTTWAQALWVIL